MKETIATDHQPIDHKYEPGTIDGFEIAGTESNGSSSDVNDFSPPANANKSEDATAADKGAVPFLIEDDDVDLDVYHPGETLKLPIGVIESLKLYVGRLEKAAGRYVCMASFTSCSEAYDNFQQFLLHIKKSHSRCRLYRCIFCGYSVPLDLVNAHIDEHFKFLGSHINRFPCPYCLDHVDGNRVRDLERHLKSHHAASYIKYPFCRFCNEHFSDVLDYCHHLERHSNILFHCPVDKCLVKSPDKMLIVNHITTSHNHDPKLTRHFRSTRHFTCNLNKSTSNKLCVSTLAEQESENDENMRVILLTCPVCESFTTRDYSAFLVHLTKCNVGIDGEDLEISQDESEVEFMLYMCSNCTATSTLESTLQFHLRAGMCQGLKASILEEHVVLERAGSLPGPPPRRRRQSSANANATAPAPALAAATAPAPADPSDVVSTASQDHSSTGSTEALVVAKEEPVFLEALIGSAIAKFDRQQLLTDSDVFADFDHFAKLKQVALDLSKMQIAVYSAMGGDHVFLCPNCSQHFSSSSSNPVVRLGVHVFTEHYSIPAAVAHRCVPALQLQIQYTDGRTEVLPKDNNVAMVIKDEPLISSIMSASGQRTTPERNGVVEDESVAVVEGTAETPQDSSKGASKTEWTAVPLLFSDTSLEKVAQMLKSTEDQQLLRNSIICYSCVQLSMNRHDKYRCNACKYMSASFVEIRRHVLRKHCDTPERVSYYMMMLARQQVCGSHHLIADDVYSSILELPITGQTRIHYKITSYIKMQKKTKGKSPSAEEIDVMAKTLSKLEGCQTPPVENKDAAEPEKPQEKKGGKKKGYLRTVFRQWKDKTPVKASNEEGDGAQKAKPGKLMPSTDDVDIDAGSISTESAETESKEEPYYASVKFNEELFLENATRIKMDQQTISGVVKKMAAVAMAKIIVKILPSGRCAFSCTCGEYQEEVQSTAVTDGPRRHALRSHVRISKVHWSLCLQATSLVLPNMDVPPQSTPSSSVSRKRRESEHAPSPPREVKKARMEEKAEEVPTASATTDNFVMVAGCKLRGIDIVTHPLDFLNNRTDSELLRDGFMGYSVGTVKWDHFLESKPVVVADKNANVLRDRCAIFCHYRVYLRNDKDGGRSHVCSACGFASSYTSRDVRRHIMVAHLGVNVQFVTSLLNACDTVNHVLSFSSSPSPPPSDKTEDKSKKGKEEKSNKEEERKTREVRETKETKEPEERREMKETKEPRETRERLREKEKEDKEREDRKKLVGHRRLSTLVEDEEIEGPLPQARHVRKLVKRCQRAGMKLRPLSSEPNKTSPSRSGRSFLDIPAILKDVELQPVVYLKMLDPNNPDTEDSKIEDDSKNLSKNSDVDPDGLCALRISKTDGITYKCSKCSYIRDNRWSVFNHLATEHANPNEKGRYNCPRCSSWFNFSHVFSRHLAQVHQLRNFEIARHENNNWKRNFPVLEMH